MKVAAVLAVGAKGPQARCGSADLTRSGLTPMRDRRIRRPISLNARRMNGRRDAGIEPRFLVRSAVAAGAAWAVLIAGCGDDGRQPAKTATASPSIAEATPQPRETLEGGPLQEAISA